MLQNIFPYVTALFSTHHHNIQHLAQQDLVHGYATSDIVSVYMERSVSRFFPQLYFPSITVTLQLPLPQAAAEAAVAGAASWKGWASGAWVRGS